ncbi:MAG TPA: MFS transporter [Trebonia sp.]|nr:MFS transporter [Trebonia sp.]
MSSSTDTTNTPDPRRWLILAVIAIAQLMVVLDISVVNIALPSAQSALHFSDTGRQWIITAYALSFGSLLLFGGKLGDIFGRKIIFIVGLIGFAVVSAIGGAATSFIMLVVARACQGAFGALLAPAALSLLTTTFRESRDRGKAFGVFGAVAGGGAAVGVLLGGLLTQYLSWRWCLYVNLVFALIAIAGAIPLLPRQARLGWHGLDLIGLLTGGGSMFCLVYGFANASTHNWHTPSTWGFLAAGVLLLPLFIVREWKAKHPLLPLGIIADRNRAGANIGVLAAGAGIFGIFLFLTFYLEQNLGYSPIGTGLAFLPMIAMIIIFSNLANIVLLPRIGPRPLISSGLLAAAGAMVWLTGIGAHTSYTRDVLGPTLLAGAGLGFNFAAGLNTGTFGVTAVSAGVASATINTMQQIGGSIGTSLLNTVATQSTNSFLRTHGATAGRGGPAARALAGQATVHGFTTAFWWSAGIFAGGALLAGAVLRSGPPGGRRPGRHERGRPPEADAIRSADATRSADAVPSAGGAPSSSASDTSSVRVVPPAEAMPSVDAVQSANAIPHADVALPAHGVPQAHLDPETAAPQPEPDSPTRTQPTIEVVAKGDIQRRAGQ